MTSLTQRCNPKCTSVLSNLDDRPVFQFSALRDMTTGEGMTFDYGYLVEELDGDKKCKCGDGI